MRRVAAAVAGAVVLGACGPGSSGGASGVPVTAVPSAITAPSAISGQQGQVLDLRVPLLGGGWLDLEALRGRPVLLELADAADGPGRDAAQGRYRALVERHGDAVAVVCVALDPTVATLPAAWVDDPPPFVLGWDPQGALAARLRLRVLPTVVLLDAQGRIVAVHEGEPPDDAALGRWAPPP